MSMRKFFILILFVSGFVQYANDDMAESARSLIRKGNSDYAKGDYAGALEKYSKAHEKKPVNLKIPFNAGDALYKLEDYEKAAAAFETSAADPKISQKAFFNRGNAFFKSGDMKNAVDNFRKAVILDTGDEDAKHNLQLSLLQLKTNPQCQKPQKKKGGGDDSKKPDNQKEQQDKNRQNSGKSGMSKEDAERILQMMKEKEKASMQPEMLNSRIQKNDRKENS